jgi:hypothetical protein
MKIPPVGANLFRVERQTDRPTWKSCSYNKGQRDALISQIYFWNRTVQVSDSSSVHHQQSSTVHTAVCTICYTGHADCLLAGSGS